MDNVKNEKKNYDYSTERITRFRRKGVQIFHGKGLQKFHGKGLQDGLLENRTIITPRI
jgi:hypothetical protein